MEKQRLEATGEEKTVDNQAGLYYSPRARPLCMTQGFGKEIQQVGDD